MTKKVIVLGVHPLATKIVKNLQCRDDVEVFGVITAPYDKEFIDPWDDPGLYNYATRSNIRIFEDPPHFLESTGRQKFDLAINVRFSHILKRDFIDHFRIGVINTHGGLLPMRAGMNIPCFNILLGDKEGGCTMHFIDESIDTGDIIDYARFRIEETDTSFSIFKKTQKAIWDVYISNIDSILSEELNRVPQEDLIQNNHDRRYFKSDDLDALKIVDPSKMTLEELDRHARAFDFPGHEPAYFLFEDRKIYLTTREHTLNFEKHISDMSTSD